MTQLLNQKFTNKTRKRLRKSMSQPEIILWHKLRNRQLNGVKFRRQFGIVQYIVDFYSPTHRLAVEIDGESHYQSEKSQEKGHIRDRNLKQLGIKIIRFTNDQITTNIEGVLEIIASQLTEKPPPTPPS